MQPVLAYLDPATGSALAQVGLAAFAAVSLGYHFARRRLGDFFSKFRGSSTLDQEAE